jgi:hypothetical protein
MPVLTIPGLWDEWKDRETGERLKSCLAIITKLNFVGCSIWQTRQVLCL